ncbi:1,6-anhydro-N-acetylmuramyl-L-alanine amidase AmpD [Teredinibacter sp. KSP-S5-2]|uniref:1,6-anhydro-N-acetylmuramyl-L-alanine amidase AmpD n=1 Tax=Teredinibacter sp. KSP-S5-2 TaxID=3034506 RepID=UPI0029347220|nr:1,6-anhydro-N-acetylmuramyl-L-alanine amidase AmpD [Teredinibacter sp. KSP-S5-2]WNO09639.1 1,6-anhydro-N-acetylmuramyl-L-alanine amidase AmpD [Teredinibacter sp. KSP-S5-2]
MQIMNGWLNSARHLPSPNYNQRPEGCRVSLLLIHNISLPPEQFGGGYIEDFFLNKLNPEIHPYFQTIHTLTVSSHCLIDRFGGIIQFVSFDDRAWHAGRSVYDGVSECNDYSIGVELEGADNIPYTEQQYNTLVELTKVLFKCYPEITPNRIAGHSDVAPGRKTDPGPAFDWHKYQTMLETV